MSPAKVRVGAARPKRRGRRVFLIGAAVVGGGLAVGAGLIASRLSSIAGFRLPAREGEASFGAWLTIDREGIVTVAVPHQEMGQGVMTTIPMLVAEELDCDPDRLLAMQAPVHPVYANPVYVLDGLPFRPDDHGVAARATRWTMDKLLRSLGLQVTGGSTSTRNTWHAARAAGASARAMLVSAAATRLGVAARELSVAGGIISHAASGRALRFGELVDDAAKLDPIEAPLKPPGEFRLIGKGIARLDVPAKVDGSARFGIDVRVEGMAWAAIRHCPQFGGALASASLPGGLPGVVKLVRGPDFAAVVAQSWWQAKKALDQAELAWSDGPNARLSSAGVFERYAQALDAGDAVVYEERGDLSALMGSAKDRLRVEYRVPYLAHATMEPMNCTARVDAGRCTVWAGNQAPTLTKWVAAGAAGVDTAGVEVITPFLGGGFGRRADLGFVREAVSIAREVPGRAVQTIWSREEDTQHDAYRPAALARFEAGFDADGRLIAWRHRIAGPSVAGSFVKRLMPSVPAPIPRDKTNAEGATGLPYGVRAVSVEHARVDTGVPVGFWRSVGHSFNAFFTECFVDECAHRAKQDPYRYRRALLEASPDAVAKRFVAVLDAAAKAAGWGAPLASANGKRAGRGIAIAESFGSIVAEVVEVEVSDGGEIRVAEVFAAVDCGIAVDPRIVRAQVASGIVFGLTAALHGRIDVEGGRVKQSNFYDYPMLTLASCPRIEVAIVDSGADLGGIGEVGTPPIAPALANAVFAATGNRLRELPLRLA